MARSNADQTTVAAAAAILAAEQAAVLNAASFDALLYDTYYFPIDSTSIDVKLRAKKACPHDITVAAYSRSGSSNYQNGTGGDGDRFFWYIRAGELESNSVTVALASTPTVEGNYFYFYTGNSDNSAGPTPNKTEGTQSWSDYAAWSIYIRFEKRSLNVPSYYVRKWDCDPATVGILPLSGGRVSGGADIIDLEYPSFNAVEKTFMNPSNNGMDQAVYTHPLMMSGAAGGYAVFNETIATIPINPFPITSGKRGLRLEYTATPLTWSTNYGPAATGSRNWSQAWAFTASLMHSRYGYYEIRAKYPTGRNGQWPICFWSTGTLYWPMEIDIAEFFGNDSKTDIASFNMHAGTRISPGSDTKVDCGVKIGGYIPGFNINDWHLYGLLWTRDYLYFYVDGIRVNAIKIDDDRNNGLQQWIMQFQSYNNSPNTADFPISSGASPSAYQEMQVEYIRIYQDDNRDTTDEPKLAKPLFWLNQAVTTERSGYKWDATTVTPGFVLSSADAIATVAPLADRRDYYDPLDADDAWFYQRSYVRSYGSVKTGKKYASIQLAGPNQKVMWLGTAAAAMYNDPAPGETVFGYYHNYTALRFGAAANEALKYDNSATTLSGSPQIGSTDLVEVCVDQVNFKFWWRVNGGGWMGTTTSADPTNSSTGLTIPSKLQGKALLLGMWVGYTAAETDSASFVTGSPPSGYSNF